MSVSRFLDKHFRHFNARETLEAARAWRAHLDGGGKMLLALAGAMSTAELGISLARMIREGKIHAISCTAANLEEDLFNLVAHEEYRQLPRYRELSRDGERALRDEGFNRVTDTGIPESVIRHLEAPLIEFWKEAAERHQRYFPSEYLLRLLADGRLKDHYQIPPEHCWALAASEMNIPVYTPGWEDSTMGNVFTARVIDGTLEGHHVVKSGTEQMQHLVDWYTEQSASASIGFFQIGGGIAGDFAICAVPLLIQDLHRDCPLWGYFAQISDSTTSFGSYSGATPGEKITWWKLDPEAPTFMIESDASIVAPLIFAYVLGD